MAYAIKVEINNPSGASFVFNAQKTMYGGKRISEGDTIFIFASENEVQFGSSSLHAPLTYKLINP